MSTGNTATVELSAEGLGRIATIARAHSVTPRIFLEALMHYAISCEEREGSWEANTPFTLANYVGDEGFADRWFTSDAPQPGDSRDETIALMLRAGELDDAMQSAWDRDDSEAESAAGADLDVVEARLEEIRATDRLGYDAADDFVWERRFGPIPPATYWAERARRAQRDPVVLHHAAARAHDRRFTGAPVTGLRGDARMTPLSEAHTEMRLFVELVERRVATLQGVPDGAGRWEDHRLSMLGDLWKALDRIEPKLGLRLIVALYPELQEMAEILLAKHAGRQRGATP